MALTERTARPNRQGGSSLIELVIAMVMLAVGILGCAVAIPFAIGRDFANQQQTNSTVLARTVLEKLASLPVQTSSGTITDCASNTTTVNASGSSSGSGSQLQQTGQGGGTGRGIDFTPAQGSAGAPAGYYMNYTTCGTNGSPATYDVRWNIRTPTNYVKLITVSAKLKGSTTDPKLFSLPVTVRTMIGQGN